ncbi:acyltransferase family protein [Pediococcus siamensis]|uniref:acyltransferase family protein n=1 Tax=Pediococcus siamensis TaxID=381829 RepID=UPI00399F7546
MASKSRVRNSNIELLRLFCMFLIILHHFSVHGVDIAGWDQVHSSLINKIIAELLSFGGRPAVIVFMLISGYFLVTSKHSGNLKKALQLWLEVWFYSVGVYLVLVLVNAKSFAIGTFVKACLPITFDQYWFITGYFLIYLLSPYLNKILLNCSKKEFVYLLLFLGTIETLIPTFLDVWIDSGSVLLFAYFYAIGAFIRLYGADYDLAKIGKLLWTASLALMFLSVITLNLITAIFKVEVFADHATHFLSVYSILVLMFAIGLFLTCLTATAWHSSAVNFVSKSAFAIYLIHDNRNFREVLWQDILHVHSLQNSHFLLLYGLCDTVLIFLACILLDIALCEVGTLLKEFKLKSRKVNRSSY